MEVAETMTFDEYWSDPRFSHKKPILSGSKKQAYGDNIYHYDPDSNVWIQEDSHHSYEGGTPNPRNIDHDTQANRILVGNKFAYWGGKGPKIPAYVRYQGGQDMCANRGYKCKFHHELTQAVLSWIESQQESGYVGEPLDW